ncbi:MAG: NAD(P) transhydrogenase subunit alpha [Ignavibacterium sp.]|jgi:NAD(P) transhydrogenase subunit alpha
MTEGLMISIYVFVLAAFVGVEVISKVPPLLHTPLMSGSNAISGITLVGSLIAAGEGHGGLSVILGFIAVVLATVNVVGGFLVTDRMLKMFKKEPQKKDQRA